MKRQAFLEKLEGEHRQFAFKNLIYVDETGFDSQTHRASGWAQKGLKILGEVTGKRKRRTNLIMAQRHGRKGERKELRVEQKLKRERKKQKLFNSHRVQLRRQHQPQK